MGFQMFDNKGLSGTKKGDVKLEHLTKRYGDIVAVNDVSLIVQQGEFLTLLGPSGSGKTTILMMIAGFQIPSHGMIYIGEESIISKPPDKRNIGMVFQHYALFPHKTVFDNIAFPLKMRKMNKREISEMVHESLALVKLGGYWNRYPKQLSGGQQQRIALARALVFNPAVLLMDEPLGALDKKLREHMQIEIKNLVRKLNITVIYVTHDQQEALTMSDRIAVVNQGRIEQIGPPDSVYETPANWFVADFIGESNLMEGTINEIDRGLCTIILPKGSKVNAIVQEGISLNQSVKCAIRPEKIFFVDESGQFFNTFEGIIEEIIYMGNLTKYRVRLVNEEISLNLNQQARPRVSKYDKGGKVKIGWNPEDVRIVS